MVLLFPRRSSLRYRFFVCFFLSLLFVNGVFAVSSARKVSSQAELSSRISTEPQAVDEVCGLIYQGKFELAGKMLQQFDLKSSRLTKLKEIVQQYQSVKEKRDSDRKKAYEEQLAKLDKFQTHIDVNDILDIDDVNDANDVNDIDDANSSGSVILAIVRVCEFATQLQRQEILDRPFVKKIFQKRIDKAAEYESIGKWLDAYLVCYSWLQAIDPNNKAYEDYSDQLIEKANIVASFQDSPCETSKERYEGVRKEMFIRAIDALEFNYVSPLDYRQMAIKAVKRTELLTEVMISSFSQIQEKGSELLQSEDPDRSFMMPASSTLAAFSAGLTEILAEVNDSIAVMSKDKFITIFNEILELNDSTVKFPRTVLIAQFVEASLSSLDPYTTLIWPRQVPDFERQMTNEFTGIGVEISKEKGQLTIVSLLPDAPAYNSGLDADDIIEAVDGLKTKDMSLTCAVKHITGPKGTEVKLTIRRASLDKPFDITINRDRIVVAPVRGWQRKKAGQWRYMIDEQEKIGYVRVTSFDERTSEDFEGVITDLERRGLTGLILDLRFNPGGLLNSAIEVADKFLEKGLIVSTRPRFAVWTWALAHAKQTHPNYPVVVLINSSSASASEIVAGALADDMHERAVLVGQRTHGKGSVQGITHYTEGGSKLKYTMAYYHLPSGQRVESKEAVIEKGLENWGVAPDVAVKLRSNEIKKMIEVRRDNGILFKAEHEDNGSKIKKYTDKETVASDPQLEIAMLIVKAKRIHQQALITADKN